LIVILIEHKAGDIFIKDAEASNREECRDGQTGISYEEINMKLCGYSRSRRAAYDYLPADSQTSKDDQKYLIKEYGAIVQDGIYLT
jgi:hypothetical protein